MGNYLPLSCKSIGGRLSAPAGRGMYSRNPYCGVFWISDGVRADCPEGIEENAQVIDVGDGVAVDIAEVVDAE